MEYAATTSDPRCPIITEYIEKATPQVTSLIRAGIQSLTKSLDKTLFRTNIFRKSSFTSLLLAETIRQTRSSINLEIAVAKPTPIAPSFGVPNKPKIKTAFKTIFKIIANVLSAVQIATLPTLRSTDR